MGVKVQVCPARSVQGAEVTADEVAVELGVEVGDHHGQVTVILVVGVAVTQGVGVKVLERVAVEVGVGVGEGQSQVGVMLVVGVAVGEVPVVMVGEGVSVEVGVSLDVGVKVTVGPEETGVAVGRSTMIKNGCHFLQQPRVITLPVKTRSKKRIQGFLLLKCRLPQQK